MSIRIIKTGVMTSLQDTGRTGSRSMGIGTGGAMDIFAMKVSNFLVGNDENAPVIEINFPAPEILFQQDALIGLAGADLSATINNKTLGLWGASWVTKGDLLKFKKPVHGARAYLSVKGGWAAEKWMNSCSTNLQAVAGGHFGRALKKNDVISYNGSHILQAGYKMPRWYVSPKETAKVYSSPDPVRCIKGVEWQLLDDASKQKFEKHAFEITNQSDRMGYRLKSRTLALNNPAEIISSAVDSGTIQLLPDGNLIILMADHQTTGGYPRIASVIKAELPRLAQVNPGQKISFRLVSLKEAEEALISMKQSLTLINDGCVLNLEKYLWH